MSDTDAIATDLGRHMVAELAPLLQRHFAVAAAVLPPDSLALMMIGFSRTITLSMIATMLAQVPEEVWPELFDKAVHAFTDGLAGKRGDVLAEVKAKLATGDRQRAR